MPENADALSKIKHSRKNCIFCGSLPKNKTKEHILPQWLLKWTGDENRTWTYLPGLSPNGGDVAFSLNSLTFPACDLCNSEKSDFEAKAQAIIGKIDKRNAVSAEEAMLLLDWLDKIRIGLWLGYNTLSQNAAKIDPRFYINERMRSKDRILAVYPYNGTPQIGMNVFGADTPIFFYQPSCFGIKITAAYI